MNWIKGFDRIFLIISIPVFLLSVASAFYNLSIFENYPFFPVGEPNPAYDERHERTQNRLSTVMEGLIQADAAGNIEDALKLAGIADRLSQSRQLGNPEMERLYTALRNAHNAGDTEAVRRLSEYTSEYIRDYWEKIQQKPEAGPWEKYQNEIPRYLPAKAYKRFSFAVGVGLCVSAIWLGLLCGTTRLIRISGKFTIGGFKKRDS